MKIPRLVPSLIAITSTASFSQGAGIIQTFEIGEDESAWGAGSSWSNGATVPTFLAPSFGGLLAGGGASATQGFSRSFKNSPVVDASTAYTISLYVQVEPFDGPEGGEFEIMDGSLGASTANVRIRTDSSGGSPTFHWEAVQAGGTAVDLGIQFTVGSPYMIEFTIDPDAATYATTISLVDDFGSTLGSGSASNLAFNPSVVTNGQNGELTFHIVTSAGGTISFVDNINITNIPEPAIPGIAVGSVISFALGRRRPSAT